MPITPHNVGLITDIFKFYLPSLSDSYSHQWNNCNEKDIVWMTKVTISEEEVSWGIFLEPSAP